MSFVVSAKQLAFSGCGPGPIAAVGFGPSWAAVIAWLLARLQNVILATSPDKLAELFRGAGPGTIIVPSDTFGAKALKALKKRWPGARLVMLFRKSVTDEGRQTAIRAMADGRDFGAFLVKAAEGMRQLARFLGIKCAGDTLHDYELEEFLGAGGFGEVWLAKNVNTGLRFALKLVYAPKGGDGRQFDVEFRAVQRYQSVVSGCRHAVQIFHVGRDRRSQFFFYVMALADDIATQRMIHPKAYQPKTLKSLLVGGKPLGLSEAIRYAKAILDGLSELHVCALLHEDVKPDNVVFVENEIKLADIGLLTPVGQRPPAWTKGFAPPEEPAGKYRDDTYAVGKLLYVMLTLGNPLELDSYQVEALQHDAEESPNVWTIIARACANDPEARYQSAADMKSDLEKLG